MASKAAEFQWFEVDKTQKLAVIDADSVLDPLAMCELGAGESVCASHLHVDIEPTVSQRIAVQIKREQAVVVDQPAHGESTKIWILLAAILVTVALVAFAP